MDFQKQSPEMFYKNRCKFRKIHRKTLVLEFLFFNKVAGLRDKTLLKKRLWHRCFPVNFAKFLRTPFLQNTSRRLFLDLVKYISSNPIYRSCVILVPYPSPIFLHASSEEISSFEKNEI